MSLVIPGGVGSLQYSDFNVNAEVATRKQKIFLGSEKEVPYILGRFSTTSRQLTTPSQISNLLFFVDAVTVGHSIDFQSKLQPASATIGGQHV